MAKSTPISQIQQQHTNNPDTVYNQQLPQNHSQDDDDNSILDVLGSLNQSSPNILQKDKTASNENRNWTTASQPIENSNYDLIEANKILEQLETAPNTNKLDRESLIDNLIMSNSKNNENANKLTNLFANKLKDFKDDFKIAIVIFGVVYCVHFIPLDKYLTKYFHLEKIPNYQIIIRALLASILVLVIKYIF